MTRPVEVGMDHHVLDGDSAVVLGHVETGNPHSSEEDHHAP